MCSSLAAIFFMQSFTVIFLNQRMRYSCKRLNFDFCNSQNNVGTALRRGGQNYSRLRQVFFAMCQKLLESENVSQSY